jgi:O-acetyl-ADP-ribose deacetylase (regulator of RNase III)
MPVEYRTGDLFLSDADALAHGCNCQGVMGAGIAVQFKKRYPEMFKQYQEECRTKRFVIGSVLPYFASDGRLIFNLGTQKYPGACADLKAIQHCLDIITNYPVRKDETIHSIALPRIGCGLGGLSWKDVQKVIEEVGALAKMKLIVYSL